VLTLFFARRSIRKIENQASELSRVSWHMLQDQESLARRFSHELHDELGQSLAAVKANLNLGKPSDWAARRADCANLVDAAIANVRELSQLLHPVILDDFGLDAGLRWLTEGFEQRTGISTRYVSDFNLRLRDDVETHFFRIAQEALTNIARHSNASAVRVELSELHGVLSMTVEDNGRGLDGVQLKQPSIGMTGMRARAKEVGATLHFEQSDIGTAKGKGLRVAVHVPLQAVLNPEEANEKANLAG
jgi:signal transduction histidine kinase